MGADGNVRHTVAPEHMRWCRPASHRTPHPSRWLSGRGDLRVLSVRPFCMAPVSPPGPLSCHDDGIGEEVRFRDDLYAGAAEDYQRYRPAYPARLRARLIDSAGVSGHGQLLD